MGNNNLNLKLAKLKQHDEFYTQLDTVESELSHYQNHFAGKVVYCNCDDPRTSEFWRYFVRNFKPLRLKKLIATHYETNAKNYSYKLELNGDTNSDGRITDDDVIQKPIRCNGDFRSQTCIDLLDQSDIVVTNPPFSLFREYFTQLMTHHKKFLIIANLNAVTYKEVFPYIMDGKVWLGYHNGHTKFAVPDTYTIPDWYDTNDKAHLKSNGYIIDENGRLWRNMGNICWFTNLDIPRRHYDLKTELLGNKYDSSKMPKIVNYEGISVNRVKDIPLDYSGNMAVPLSYVYKHNPDQFEIVGSSGDLAKPMNLFAQPNEYQHGGRAFYVPKPTEKDKNRGFKYHREFDRLVIRNRKPQKEN